MRVASFRGIDYRVSLAIGPDGPLSFVGSISFRRIATTDVPARATARPSGLLPRFDSRGFDFSMVTADAVVAALRSDAPQFSEA